MGKSQRTKGHSFERKVAAQLREIFPDAKRHLEYQDGEAYGVDIANTGPFAIQCKKHRNYVSITKIFEVKDDSKIPVLVTAGDRLEAMAVLPFNEFLRLVKHGKLSNLDDKTD